MDGRGGRNLDNRACGQQSRVGEGELSQNRDGEHALRCVPVKHEYRAGCIAIPRLPGYCSSICLSTSSSRG
jgi:hypothetical protein